MTTTDILTIENDYEANAVIADDSILKLIRELKMLREEKKVLEEREKFVKEFLINTIKENEVICTEDGIVLATAKHTNITRFDTEGFRDSYPDLYKMYTKKISSRPFLLKE